MERLCQKKKWLPKIHNKLSQFSYTTRTLGNLVTMSSAAAKYLANIEMMDAESKKSSSVDVPDIGRDNIQIVYGGTGDSRKTKMYQPPDASSGKADSKDLNDMTCEENKSKEVKSLKPPPPPPRRHGNGGNAGDRKNGYQAYSYIDIGMTNEALSETGLTSDGYPLLLDISTGLKGQTGLYQSNYRTFAVGMFYGILLVPFVKVNNPGIMVPSILIGLLFIIICILLSPENRIYQWKYDFFDKLRLKLLTLCPFLKYDTLKYCDFPSFISGVPNEDKGMVLDNSGWYLVIGGYWLVLSKFFAQVKSNSDGNDEYYYSRCGGDYEYLNEADVKDGSCLVTHVVTSCISAYFSYLIGMFMVLNRTATIETSNLSSKVKINIKNRFSDNKSIFRMGMIDKIHGEAVNHDESVDIVTLPFFIGYHFNSWKRCAAYYTFTLLVSLNAIFGYDRKIFWDVSGAHIVPSYGVYFFTAPCLAFWAYAVSKQLWLFNRYLFLFDYIAMSNLDGAIYIGHVKDILCWFDMRQYYTNYVQPIRSSLRGSPPSALISAVLVGYRVISNEHESVLFLFKHPSYVILFVTIIIVIIAMSIFIYTAVLTWQQQLAHVSMLKREVIRLKSLIDLNQNVDCGRNDRDNYNGNVSSLESGLVITKKVVEYLQQFDQAPKILGIPMNYAVLATAVGYIASFVVLIAGSFFG